MFDELTASGKYTEKRRHARFAMDIPMHYFDPVTGAVVNANLRDISAAGLGMLSPRPLIPGSCLEVFLHMPDSEEKIYKKCMVCWSNPTETGRYRSGVKLGPPEINPIPLVLRSIIAKRRY